MIKTMADDSIVRVLVVEDHLPFRRFISTALNKKRNLQIICEVSDGLEAIQKAVQLKPDMILLDIGLPTLNGIEVARQIRRVVPQSKIIFLTTEFDAAVVQQAATLGASGYVVKTMAGVDLLTAVEAVISGKHFASGSLGEHFRLDASHVPGLYVTPAVS
jgi:DNA-binding NarL/FixJ family response regulator